MLYWMRWLACLACGAWLSVAPAQAQLLKLDVADTAIRAAGRDITRHNARLPYSWDAHHPGQKGVAVFRMHWSMPQPSSQAPHALYFERLGNRAEVWLNGVQLSSFGKIDSGDRSDHGKTPQLISVQTPLLRAENQLVVVVDADAGRRGGLSAVLFGQEAELRQHLQGRHQWLFQSSIGAAVMGVFIALMVLLLGPGLAPMPELAWRQEPPSQRAIAASQRHCFYAGMVMSQLCWVVLVSDVAWIRPPLVWPLWHGLHALAFAGWLGAVVWVCQWLVGRGASFPHRWTLGLILGWLFCSPLAIWISHAAQAPIAIKVWYAFTAITAVVCTLCLVWQVALGRRSGQWARMELFTFGSGVLTVLVGARDGWVWGVCDGLGEVFWSRYSSALFGIQLLLFIAWRMRRANHQARELTRHASQLLRNQEQELNSKYQRIEGAVREQERTAERERILLDMHDGVGAHLSAAIRQLQSGHATQEQVLRTLKESMDYLKLSIDTMNVPAGDVTALLANLRYRLEPRLRATDIELIWDVEPVIPLLHLQGVQLRHLQFMVFEAVSNALQHAGCNQLRLELGVHPQGGVQLWVIDNGQGLTLPTHGHRCLSALRRRARISGFALDIQSEPGRTAIGIWVGAPASAGLPGGPNDESCACVQQAG